MSQSSAWFKLLTPLFGIAVALTVARIKGVSFRDDLALRLPSLPSAAFWLAVWAAMILIGEYVVRTFALNDAERWENHEWSAVLLRAVPLILLGPVVEELAFRGFLFFRLSRFMAPLSTIVLLAVAWAALHYRYGFANVGLLVADGICLGLARWRSGSLLLPMTMHIIGNAISVGQSLSR